jgi:hypothetical protein
MRSDLFALELSSGSYVRLEKVMVSATYESLLEGRPSKAINDLILQPFDWDTDKFWPSARVAMLGMPALGEREILPEYRMIGEFRIPPDFNKVFFVAVWFQDELLPIISPENVESLRAANASDFKNPPNALVRWIRRRLYRWR